MSFRKSAVSSLVCVGLLSTIGLGTALPANAAIMVPAGTAASNTLTAANKQQIIDIFNGINAYRAQQGVAPLNFNVTVSEMSEDWSDSMSTKQVLEHNPDFGTDVRVANRFQFGGEIIASRTDLNAADMVNQWIGSTLHAETMRNPDFKTMGIGITMDANKGIKTFGTVNFFKFNPGKSPAGTYQTASDFVNGGPELVETAVTPVTPVWNDATAQYTIPSQVGIDYYNADTNALIPAGTYTAGFTAVRIEARARANYYTTGTAFWLHTFTAPVQDVTPVAPTFNNFDDTYTIPSGAVGYMYNANGQPVSPGTYNGSGFVTISTQAFQGYRIVGTKSWSNDFSTSPIVIEPGIPDPNTPPVKVAVTPAAPGFNGTTGAYTIPAKAGVDYFVNGVAKATGTYGSNWTTISVTAKAKAGYTLLGTTSWSYAFVRPANPSIKNKGDLITVDTVGRLWNYGMGPGKPRVMIGGSGWQTMAEIHVADWNADGWQDIVAKRKDGGLWLYKGNKYGGFSAVRIGTGWGSYDINVAKWKTTDRYPSIIAKDASGNLWNYTNPAGGSTGPRVQIGAGWKPMYVNLLDWDKDGKMDVVARASNGNMVLYRTNGAGKFLNEARKTVGTGWAGFNSINTATGWSGGATTVGFFARTNAGEFFYYPANKNAWGSRIRIGSGWNGYNIAGH